MFLPVLVFCFVAFSVETDVYVPAFSLIISELQISEQEVQRLLSLNFFAICLSCLVAGPLSDTFGRRFVLVLGTGLFALASYACVYSNFNILLLGRFLQGLGAGTILAVASSCIFDRFDAVKSGKLIAFLNSIVSVTMALAPVLGSLLTEHLGWRSSLYFLMFLSNAAFLLIVGFLPETLLEERRTPFSTKSLVYGYLGLIKNSKYLFGTLSWCFMFAFLIVYTSNSSLYFVHHRAMPVTTFGFFQGVIMAIFSVSSLFNSMLFGTFSTHAIKRFGVFTFFGGVFFTVLVPQYFDYCPFLIAGGIGLCAVGISFSIFVLFSESIAGLGSVGAGVALAQGLRLLIASAGTDIARLVFDGSFFSMITPLLGLAAFSGLAIIASTQRHRHQVASQEAAKPQPSENIPIL